MKDHRERRSFQKTNARELCTEEDGKTRARENVEGRSRLSEAVRVAKAEQIPPFPPLTAFQGYFLFLGKGGVRSADCRHRGRRSKRYPHAGKAFLPNEAILKCGVLIANCGVDRTSPHPVLMASQARHKSDVPTRDDLFAIGGPQVWAKVLENCRSPSHRVAVGRSGFFEWESRNADQPSQPPASCLVSRKFRGLLSA